MIASLGMLLVLGYSVYGLFQPSLYIDTGYVIPHPEDYDALEDKLFLIVEKIATALSTDVPLSEDESEAILEDTPRVAIPGGLTALPTPDVPGSEEQFNKTADRVTTLASYLMAALRNGIIPEKKIPKAWKVLEWLLEALDMMTNLRKRTKLLPVDPVTGEPQFPDLGDPLEDDDMFGLLPPFTEIGMAGYSDSSMELVTPVKFPYMRVIWSNFWPPGYLNTEPKESVIVTDAIPLRACVSITKESKGIVPIVVTMKVPIWVKPLFGESSVVGETYVWALWWVPAEFIKTITYCNPSGFGITEDITQKLILNWAEGHLWWYYVNP